MQANAYLEFNGQCEAAFKFYEQNLGGQIIMMMNHEGLPAEDKQQIPEDMQNMILHARLDLGSTVIMGSDTPTNRPVKPQGFSVSLLVDTPEEAERIFKALSENGSVRMPIEETFWAHRFGMVTDQFGTPWMVNCEKTM
ncbi:VOC family protein [Capsulimonas corticalis]|uniref:VOC family protein n=1 Tax=Capsulimonas corticalis TaxID=2219043 RepID=A0A402D508_9BACT|nr:VOC family protein [Capsulimonas corticalis]BDI31979.1 VOC family protein [Capsulimonas corticalis]